MERYEYEVIDTGKHVEEQLKELGAQGWQVVRSNDEEPTTDCPTPTIILMRELQQTGDAAAAASLVHARA